MRAFVTGSLGQLGQDLRPLLGSDTVWTDLAANAELNVEAVDIIDQAAVQAAIEAANPNVIYHCAAYTNVDGAESEEAIARSVNVDGTKHVADAAAVVGAKLVTISTDFVFDGSSDVPYVETDEPNPLSVYGRTKLEAEEEALMACDDTFVVRTAWLYGPKQLLSPVKNFPQTMKRLAVERSVKNPPQSPFAKGEAPLFPTQSPLAKREVPLFSKEGVGEISVVNDQTGAPTFSADLAQAIITLAKTNDYGIWHITNSGTATWYDYACEILKEEIAAGKVKVRPIPTSGYSTPAKRPKYSVLDTTKFTEIFGPLRSWQDALTDYLVAH